MARRRNPPDMEGTLHFVTLNIRERKTAFSRPEYAEMALQLLRYECDRHPATLVAYVAMPDHLHFLFGPQDGQVQRFLARFKPNATRNLDSIARLNGRSGDFEWLAEKGSRELWQDGKHSIPTFSSAWIEQKIDYIHNNPVRRGLVENAEEFQYSSFGAYFPDSGHEPLVRVDNWEGAPDLSERG